MNREIRIFTCTESNPWLKGNKVRPEYDQIIHIKAREIADYGETRRMECPVCGTSWKEELAQ